MEIFDKAFVYDIRVFLESFFTQSEVFYLNNQFKKISNFLTFLCQVGDLELLISIHPLIDSGLLNIACQHGSLSIIKWIINTKQAYFNRCSFNCAIQSQNIHVLEFLLECGCSLNQTAFLYAVKNIHILKWLKKQNCILFANVFARAADHGNLNILKWLRENNCPWDENTFACAARHGNINILTWLKDNNCPSDWKAFVYAAEGHHVDVLRWLNENHYDSQTDAYSQALIHNSKNPRGCLEVLQWLFDNHISMNSALFHFYTIFDFEIIQWIYNHKKPLHEYVLDHVIQVTNDISKLEWILDHGGKFSEFTAVFAASRGDIHIMEWLKSKNCLITGEAYRTAARRGHIKILNWLFENNINISSVGGIYEQAAQSGSIEILDWLYNKNCDFGEEALLTAGKGQNLQMLEWFRTHNFRFENIGSIQISSSYEYFSLEVIEWFQSYPELFPQEE